jgi:hypothetical protein
VAATPETYARLALDQIPRLLGNQDRDPLSPTYGCFHRDYWLDKTSDFPDAVRQFAMHAIALVYRHPFVGNPYHEHPKVRDWAIAGLDFWTRIQHKEGSFDEFYPYERGWVGPTAFTTYAAVETFRLMEEELEDAVATRAKEAIRRAAAFVAAGESEEDHLANHHAMACLAVWKAFELLGDPELEVGFHNLWRGFLGYHNAEEGWSREYDGIDPGYLSATVSFLAKVNQTKADPEIAQVLAQSVETCSYFAFPNGSFGGTIGSRNTLHFYPHGFELLAGELPTAASVAEWMLVALAEGKLVPPGIISDRYVVYRVPEYLLAFLDAAERNGPLEPLPWQRGPFTEYRPEAGIHVVNRPTYYAVSNLSKGGVVKVFDGASGTLALNDGGFLGKLEAGQVVSSQWIDPAYERTVDDTRWTVEGSLHIVPSKKTFTPLSHLLFRGFLVLFGRVPAIAHWLKGRIRKALILGADVAPARFHRECEFGEDSVTIRDEVVCGREVKLSSLQVGDEFVVRHVPQSRYFQSQELDAVGWELPLEPPEAGARIFRLTRVVQPGSHLVEATVEREP